MPGTSSGAATVGDGLTAPPRRARSPRGPAPHPWVRKENGNRARDVKTEPHAKLVRGCPWPHHSQPPKDGTPPPNAHQGRASDRAWYVHTAGCCSATQRGEAPARGAPRCLTRTPLSTRDGTPALLLRRVRRGGREPSARWEPRGPAPRPWACSLQRTRRGHSGPSSRDRLAAPSSRPRPRLAAPAPPRPPSRGHPLAGRHWTRLLRGPFRPIAVPEGPRASAPGVSPGGPPRPRQARGPAPRPGGAAGGSDFKRILKARDTSWCVVLMSCAF